MAGDSHDLFDRKPNRDQLFVNQRPWLTALACVAGMGIAAGCVWLLEALL